VAVPLVRLATVLGLRTTVVDARPRFASRERFPDVDAVVVDAFRRAIEAQEITPWTYLVLVTRGHEHDEATLQRVVGSPAPYIGMIGSRRRVLLVFQRLAEQGVPQRFVDRIYAPIGLDIGARTPEEIALAILAEIVNVRRGGNAPSLSIRLRSRSGRAEPTPL
jgi:xanthine dehydrogenase accessory factor